MAITVETLARLKIGNLRYNSPTAQVTLIGIIFFLTVGMFNAVNGLGAGGTQDVILSDTASAVLYACFSIGGFFAGSVTNLLGVRLTLFLGSFGYALYIGSLWCYQATGTRWFLILAGAILGFSAALYWAAQGCVMMGQPLEKDKGRAFSIFWTLFSLGTVLGAAIALGITQKQGTLPGVSTGVYLAFLILIFIGMGLTWTMLPSQYVVRNDGTIVKFHNAISFRDELKGFVMQFRDWRMLALFPMFFSSNYFYAYQGAINAHLFDGRTRALNSLLTGFGAIIGAIIVGCVFDLLPFGRRKRAFLAWATVVVLVCAVWGGGLAFQLQFKRSDPPSNWDYTERRAIGGIILLMSYYIADAAYQGLAYSIIGSLSNDPFRLARMAGFLKGVQSGGAAISFGMDAIKTKFLIEHLVSWGLLLASLPLALLVIRTIRETNYDQEEVVRVEELDVGTVHAALPKDHKEGHVESGIAQADIREVDLDSKQE